MAPMAKRPRSIRAGIIIIAPAAIVITGFTEAHRFLCSKVARAPRRSATFVFSPGRGMALEWEQ
jgi:hypothetical protein